MMGQGGCGKAALAYLAMAGKIRQKRRAPLPLAPNVVNESASPARALRQQNPQLVPGTSGKSPNYSLTGREERTMPVLLLWAVPAVIVVGGAGYWLVHLH